MQHRHVNALLPFLLTLSVSPGCRFAGADGSDGAHEATSVRGRVVDDGGAPLAGARAWISGWELRTEGGWQVVHYSGLPRVHLTGTDGRFEVSGHKDHRVDLDVDSPGFAPAFVRQVELGTELHIVLRRGWDVGGRIVQRTPSGEVPAPHGRVTIQLPSSRGLWYQNTVLSGADGRFTFPGLMPRAGSCAEADTRWLLNVGGATFELPETVSHPIDDIRVVIEVTGG